MEKKFRSFSENDKCFYYFLNGGYFRENGTIAHSWRFDWGNAEQYIGKKDSEKIEIYVGDILKCGVETFIVFWNNKESAFNLRNIKTGWLYNINSFIDTLKIVGTKHQDPELLEL